MCLRDRIERAPTHKSSGSAVNGAGLSWCQINWKYRCAFLGNGRAVGNIRHIFFRHRRAVRQGDFLAVFHGIKFHGIVFRLPQSIDIQGFNVGESCFIGKIRSAGSLVHRPALKGIALSLIHILVTGAVLIAPSAIHQSIVTADDTAEAHEPEPYTLAEESPEAASAPADTQIPELVSYECIDGTIVLTLKDDLSGVDYAAITASSDNGPVPPVNISEAENQVIFEISNAPLTVNICDKACLLYTSRRR